jgi:multiple sugar transport system substrate-binding protein
MSFTKRASCIVLALCLCAALSSQPSKELKPSSEIEQAVQKVLVEKQPVEISFWTGTGAQNLPFLQAMVEAFMGEYPNIKVDFSNQGALNDLTVKLTQNIVSRTTPTVSNINSPTFPEYIASDAIVDLAPFLNDPKIGYTAQELADFFQNYIEEVKSFGPAGTMYAWPTNKKTTDILNYNKTFFDAHGWTAPKTWDEVVAYSEIIKKETGKPGFSYDTSYGEAAFKTMSTQWGSPYVKQDGTVDVDNEASLAVLKFYKENMDKGLFTLPALMPSAGGNYSNSAFVMEECYMFVGPAAGIQYNIPNPAKGQKNFEVGVAPVPQKDVNNPATFSKGENYAVFSNSTVEQRVAAWLLITYLSDAENNVQWLVNTGNLPISNSQVDTAGYQAFLASKEGKPYYYAIAVKAALDMKDYMRYDVAFDQAGQLAAKVGTMWKSVLIGGADPAKSLAALQAEFK